MNLRDPRLIGCLAIALSGLLPTAVPAQEEPTPQPPTRPPIVISRLTVSPASLSFTARTGMANPPGQPITIDALPAAVAWTATSSASWLAVTPSSGTTPSTALVTVNATRLAPGPYSATINIEGVNARPASVAVSLQVICERPQITSIAPSSQAPGNPVVISGSNLQGTTAVIFGTKAAGFSATSNQITATVPSLPPGPVPVTVTTACGSGNFGGAFTVLPSPALCSLNAAPQSLTFNAMAGGPNPPGQVISLTSPQGTVPFVTAAGERVSVSPASGTTPASLAVNVNTAGLAAGPFTSAVGVACAGSGVSTFQQIPVTINVAGSGGGGELSVTPSTLSFTGVRGGPNPPPQTVSVSSTGGPLSFSINMTGDFFTVSPTIGTTPANLGVTVSIGSRPEGTYNGTITVSSPGKASRGVAVQLTVTAPPGLLMVSPTSLSFTTSRDLDPPSRTLTILSSGAPLNWSVSSTAPFISLGSSSGVTPSSTFVAINAVGLPPGTYSGSVNVTAPGAGSLSVPVSLTITP